MAWARQGLQEQIIIILGFAFAFAWLRFQFADACWDLLEMNDENKSRRRCAREGEDLPMKGKMCPLKGRCAHEKEDLPMKGKMCPWKGRCAHEGEDVPMKGKMCPWKERCAYEGEDVPMKGKMCLWRGRCALEKGTFLLWKHGIWHIWLRFRCSGFALWGYIQIISNNKSLFHPNTCRRGEPFSLLLKWQMQQRSNSCWRGVSKSHFLAG